jgi:hypothetical protein
MVGVLDKEFTGLRLKGYKKIQGLKSSRFKGSGV